ncbi:hypothetical protein [Burkholderia ubonensis]|uniref:hypothetical protein n=2 Tax=Burkholderia ubonensis TaxID=101571 RepID=UPI000ADAFDC5|nr:hypothetical protein [Burkholderia ubonensis]
MRRFSVAEIRLLMTLHADPRSSACRAKARQSGWPAKRLRGDDPENGMRLNICKYFFYGTFPKFRENRPNCPV